MGPFSACGLHFRSLGRHLWRLQRLVGFIRVLFLHRAFAKGRASFSATARRCFLSASFDWLSWLSLPAREAAAFKSGFHVETVAARRGACWFFSSVLLARHPTSSMLLLPGCVWNARPAAVALSLIRGAGSTDGAGFCLCLLRCIQLGAAASVALVKSFSWLTFDCRGFDTMGPRCQRGALMPALIARFKVSLSGLLLSPSSVLRSTQVLSLGLCSLLLDQRRHVRLVSMRGSLGIVISFNQPIPGRAFELLVWDLLGSFRRYAFPSRRTGRYGLPFGS